MSRCEYERCGLPAHWYVGHPGLPGYGWQACEAHSISAAREGSDEVSGFDGDRVELVDGELVLSW